MPGAEVWRVAPIPIQILAARCLLSGLGDAANWRPHHQGMCLANFFDQTFTQRGGQIIKGKEVLKSEEYKGVWFLGRYAQWDHAVKFNDVLKRIIFDD